MAEATFIEILGLLWYFCNMTYLFLDTNIFLHFKYFEEIHWKKIANDDFIIIIAPIVLDELDKHKRNVNTKISTRAKAVLGKIETIVTAANAGQIDHRWPV